MGIVYRSVDRAAEQKSLMKLVCRIYETPGALEQMEGEIRAKDDKKRFLQKKSEGPLDSKDVKRIMENPTLVSIVTTLCAENAMYTESLKALATVARHSEKKGELAAQVKFVQQEKGKKLHRLKELEGVASTVNEFAEVLPVIVKKSMETIVAVIKNTSTAMQSPNLTEVGRVSMESLYDAPRIGILEQMRGDERTVNDTSVMYKALTSGEVDKLVVSGKFSFSDMAKMFTDKNTREAFVAVGTMNKEVGSKNNIDQYRSDAEMAAVKAVQEDIPEGPITFSDYTDIVPENMTDQEFLAGIQGFGEKMALASVTNRAKANVELKRTMAVAQDEHSMNFKTGKLTRVSTYGESIKNALDRVTEGKSQWSMRLVDITLGEERVKKEIQTKAEIIARFGDMPKVMSDFEEVRGIYGSEGGVVSGREDAKKLMESRKGMSVGQVMRGDALAKTTSKVTAELSQNIKGSKDRQTVAKGKSTKTVKEDR